MTDAPRMNVESFNLDHRTVRAPYIRQADRKELAHGDVVVKFDVRFTQPNVAHMPMDVMHSLEHMFAELSRNHTSDIIDFSPMGCQTGFYLIISGDHTFDQIAELVEQTLSDILGADEVPAANIIQCGWGANHTLEGAQNAAREFLAERENWSQVTA